jgi:hypothetical protein
MHRNNVVSPELRLAPYPFNFSTLREGDTDPVLGKVVKWLIDSDDDYIVYVDEDDYVEWTMNSNAMLANASDLVTRVGWLEAAETEHLAQWQIETYKRLIGEGVARLFERNYKAAVKALDAAEKWITARNQESARIWYLQGTTTGLVIVSLAFLAACWWYSFDGVTLLTARPVIYTAAFLGSVGAVLSVLQRSGQTALDIAAGSVVQRVEGLARVATGTIGAAFIALLLRSEAVLPNLSTSKNKGLFLAVCLVAGFSERLVNTLAGGVESSAGLTLTKGSDLTVPPPSKDGNSPTAGGEGVQLTPPGNDAISTTKPQAKVALSKSVAKFGAPVPPP